MDRWLASSVAAALPESGGQDGWISSPTFLGAALLATSTRSGACSEAVKGAKALLSSIMPRASLAGDEASGSGSAAVEKTQKAGQDVSGEESPPVLMMRPDKPPSFWEPESPINKQGLLDDKSRTEWENQFGTLADRAWGNPSRLSSGSSKKFKSPEMQRNVGVPDGPDGPAAGSRKDPGRPDWHRMLSEGLKDNLLDVKSVSSDDDDLSEVYPDEMSEVTAEDLEISERRAKHRALAVREAMANRSLSYGDYLHLDKILHSQVTQSGAYKQEVHDEMLFIIIHQTYELWFKQILHELDSVINRFSKGIVSDEELSTCELRCGRICQILRVLVHQFDVLETMSPQGFNDFRDFLNPASGFQSAQFRVLENKLGLRPDQRIMHSGCPYYQHLPSEEDREQVLEAEQGANLAGLLGSWLGNMMDSLCPGLDFAQFMRDAIEQAAAHDRHAIKSYPAYRLDKGKDGQNKSLEELEQKRAAHLKLFDRAAHDELVRKGIRQFSFEATMACVFVQSFAHELAMQTPHRLIMHLVEVDELLAMWRHRHSLLVMRMIGTKSGTGGSSGSAYLDAVRAKSRIFTDLCHCSHYLLPSHSMPPLPPAIRSRIAGPAGATPRATLERRGSRSRSVG